MSTRGNRRSGTRNGDPFRAVEHPDVGERLAIEAEGCNRLNEPPSFDPATMHYDDSFEENGAEPDDYEPFEPDDDHEDRFERMAVPNESPEPLPLTAQARRAPRGASPAFPPTRVLTTAEIFEPLPPTDWLVRELQLTHGRPALMYGSAGAGKTLIAQALALFVATGRDAWGQFPVRSGRVLHIDFDQGEQATRKRYQRLAAGHSIDLPALDKRLSFMPFPDVHLNSPMAEKFLLHYCHEIDFCIIDALRGALPGTDENDSRVGAYLTICSRVAAITRTVFLILHHLGKARDGASDAPMNPRGSTALLAASGAALCVTGGKDTPKRVRVVRDSESYEGGESADFNLRFEDGAPNEFMTSLRIVYEGSAATPANDTGDKRADLEAAIVAHVKKHSGCTISGVKKTVKGNGQEASRAIDDLVSRGVLTRTPGSRGAACLSVTEDADDDDDAAG